MLQPLPRQPSILTHCVSFVKASEGRSSNRIMRTTDDARVVFNGMFDRRPALILRPTGTADVIRAIGLAKTSGLPFAIRAGGHSVAAFSSTDGGIVLDLSALAGVRVDPEKRTGRAQGGVALGAFDRETQQFGLAVTGGSRNLDRSRRLHDRERQRLVGAQARVRLRQPHLRRRRHRRREVVVANEKENADLFWGLKGGGGNSVSSPSSSSTCTPPVRSSTAGSPRSITREGARSDQHLARSLRWRLRGAGLGGRLDRRPTGTVRARAVARKRMWAIAGQFAGSQDDAEKILAPMRALGPEVDLFQPMPYTVVQGLIDPANPYGRRNYWRAHNLRTSTTS